MKSYKIRKMARRGPVPMPEALPGRGDKPWEIREAQTGRAHCKYSESGGGEMAVPLTNERCKTCGKNHHAASRLHELAHAALSPDPNKIRTTFKSKGETFDASLEGIAIAEEMRADYQANRVAQSREIEYEHTCAPETEAYFTELATNQDFRQLGIEVLTNSAGLRIIDQVREHFFKLYGEARDALDSVEARRYNWIWDFLSQLRYQAYIVKSFAHDNYKANIRSWTRQLQVSYAVDRFLDALEDRIQELFENFESLKATSETAPPPPKDDLSLIRQKVGADSSEGKKAQAFLNHLQNGKSFAQFAQDGKKKFERMEEHTGDVVEWAEMKIDTPPLRKRLPAYKAGWKARASDEGTVPLYMYRHTIDGAIFKSRRQERGGSVLIDVSGSMSLSREELEAIIEAAPAAVIALHAGWGQEGTLRIIGNKGKWLDLYDIAAQHGWSRAEVDQNPHNNFYAIDMGGNNLVDKPALQWLAKQALPRIWVSDGQVVSLSHGFSAEAWEDCESIIIPNRINRVDTPEEAKLALEGKLALWR